MRSAHCVVLFAAVVAWLGCVQAANEETAAVLRLFEDFKTTYGRRYAPAEEQQRLLCFKQNLELIDQRNAADGHATHGVNQFTDLCATEFAATRFGFRPSATQQQRRKASVASVAATCSTIDWRQRGVVTPVKNQGDCSSVWAFSATGNMEGQWAMNTSQLVSMSEEELVQCAAYGGTGCYGGEMDVSFQWVITNGGISSETSYPYTSGTNGVSGTCQKNKIQNIAAGPFSSYQDLPADEQQMASWVCANGPLSVGLNAEVWQTYKGGIMTNCGSDNFVNSAALIVGFDDTNSPPYWIVKNSWGASWGEQGYIRMQMFVNLCGINQQASSIIV